MRILPINNKNTTINIFSFKILAKSNKIAGIKVNDKKKIDTILPDNILKSEKIHKKNKPNINIDKKILLYGIS